MAVGPSSHRQRELWHIRISAAQLPLITSRRGTRMSCPHLRQCLRRRAFSDRQDGQTMYMARANRLVSAQAPPRIAMANAKLNSVDVMSRQSSDRGLVTSRRGSEQ